MTRIGFLGPLYHTYNKDCCRVSYLGSIRAWEACRPWCFYMVLGSVAEEFTKVSIRPYKVFYQIFNRDLTRGLGVSCRAL